ncbi:hypothetical protein [Streptomyces sp. NEAU-174]|uniref:hypothetical protein n=1 Tax=Streptomyces sp. NEAU-174 TaxID=3458254 RepID=UPI004044F3A4
MDWGDPPTWVAIAVSLAALAYARLARGDSRRSADIAQASLNIQQTEFDERRAAAAAAAVPKVKFVVEHVHKLRYCLRNVGDATATGVTVSREGLSLVTGLPENVTLAPEAAHDFKILEAWGAQRPTALLVRWDGQDEPYPVRVPPRPRRGLTL